MLLTVTQFCNRAQRDLGNLVDDLQNLTGRYSDSEAEAWRSSLPIVAHAFSSKVFAPLHLYFGGAGRLALEYRLPAASSWCDMVLLGRHGGRPAVGVVEIKDWETRSDRPGSEEGLINRHTGAELHPSDQVRGYSEYCRRFHSTVLERGAAVHGCVLFTKGNRLESYREVPNDKLTVEFPIFAVRDPSGISDLEAHFGDRVSTPDEEFAVAFEQGIYRQERSFIRHIGEQLSDPAATPFELLDAQRKAFSIVRGVLRSTVHRTGEIPKTVVVVIGPPGSGKSVIAGKLWADMVSDQATPDGDVVFVTTSASQNSNWAEMFRRASRVRGAGGAVVKANEFVPVTTQQVGQINKKYGDVLKGPADWRENLTIFRNLLGAKLRTRDGHFLLSIVDEAHALINPEHTDGRGQFGFAIHAGPQGYHIIRGSRVSVFLMDPEQRFRERETTSLVDIQRWAAELGASPPKVVDLEGSQFRCAGSVEYLDWVEEILRNAETGVCQKLAHRWHSARHARQYEPKAAEPTPPRYGLGNGPHHLEFRIVDDPAHLERLLRQEIARGRTARLMASYARPWKTKDAANPHDLPAAMMDFQETFVEKGKNYHWSKIWNYVPRGDYSVFIHGPIGSRINEDQLCEVGCPYAVRGFDFDYVGILWLRDLKWRGGRWLVDLGHVHESGLSRHVSRARRETDPHGPEHEALLGKIRQAYRILLTRAIRGVFVWFEDEETRFRVTSCLDRK